MNNLKKKLLAGIGTFLLIIFVFLIQSFTTTPQKQQIPKVAPPTPIAIQQRITYKPKTYTDPAKQYTFSYPNTWEDTKTISNADGEDSLLYSENGHQYKFQVV